MKTHNESGTGNPYIKNPVMGIEVSVVKSKRKTAAIEVRRDARVVVRVPARASNDFIRKLIHKNRLWISEKQRLVREKKMVAPEKEFVSGEVFLYLGAGYKLEMVEEKTPLVFFDGSFRLSRDRRGNAREEFINWYRKEARLRIPERVNLYASMQGIKFSRVNITGAAGRWGSCGAKDSLNFPWRLVMAQLKVIDYVVTHEITHVAEKNHSKRFWEKVEKSCPDYRTHRCWLRENGHLLNI